MKPARFEYFAPHTVDEATALLAEHGEEAKVLAGGQSLVPMMNLRLASPAVLVDLNRVEALAGIELDGDVLRIGAMTRHRDVAASATVRAACPLLAAAAELIGYPAIRERGTIGGSIAHADPVAEMPCVATALDAELVVTAAGGGRRSIAAADFFAGYFTTALAPEELLVEIRFRSDGGATGWGFQEFARKSGDFAVAAVAAEVTLADGVVRGARLGIAGVRERPVRASAAEERLQGRRPDAALAEEVASAVAGEAAGGRFADNARVAGVLARRAVVAAVERARGTTS
jgi:carbon-monoxide dehydrogenase medium subunit